MGPKYQKHWRKINAQRVRECGKKYSKHLYNTPQGRINKLVSADLYKTNTFRKWESLVGYTLKDIKQHLETLFKPGMAWDNYGEWHLDHIIPKSLFNFSTVRHVDFRRCWALSNIQPLWAEESWSKHARLDKPFQPNLAI